MRLRLTEFRPRTGPHTHRVVRPRTALRHTSLTAPDPIGLLLGDHDGLNTLAALFSFASRSPHTIVHVPLRDGVPPDEGWGERVDLVLAHHTLGLRPSQWPGLRRGLRQGTPLTARTDEARTERDAQAWQDRRDRDDLRHTTHARTLFLFSGRRCRRRVRRRMRLRGGVRTTPEAGRPRALGDDDGTAARPGARRRAPLRGPGLLQAVSAVRAVQTAGRTSQSSTSASSLFFVSSGAAEARTD